MITELELKELLHYNPDTGIFTWLVNKAKTIKAGSVAGTLTSSGYIHIKIDYKLYKAHRLAWLYVHGKFPEHHTDHINGIRNDNRIVNLREATFSQNIMNSKTQTKNTSGYKGVSFNIGKNKFESYVSFNHKKIHIGLFDTAKEANEARKVKAKILHGEFYCDGTRL
jgi:hypothetical protein